MSTQQLIDWAAKMQNRNGLEVPRLQKQLKKFTEHMAGHITQAEAQQFDYQQREGGLEPVLRGLKWS